MVCVCEACNAAYLAGCSLPMVDHITETMSVDSAGAGTVTSVTQVSCDTYTVQGYMPQNDPFEVNSTTLVLRLNAGVASLCGESGRPAFPAASQLGAVDHR